jgi:hypothetical protein
MIAQVVQIFSPAAAAALVRAASAGVVDQHLPHGAGECSEELVRVCRLGDFIVLV